MAMASEVRTNYETRASTAAFALMAVQRDDDSRTVRDSVQQQTSSNEPFLPKIRVEACGLTVEARDRDSWKRDNNVASKSWKPGKKRRGKNRNTSSLVQEAQKMAERGGFLTIEQREADVDSLSTRLERTSGKYEKPSEFVGSLQVGGLSSNNVPSDSSRLGRLIRWPVGRLKYSTPVTTPLKSEPETMLPCSEVPLGRLSPLPSTSISNKGSAKVSPRERVILNKLAAKRKRANLRGSRKHSCTNVTSRGDADAKPSPSPINFDQFLPTTHCIHLTTLTNIPAKIRTRKSVLRGDEFYDIIDNATQKLLEKHQSTDSTSASTAHTSASTASRCGTSGYGSMDEWHTASHGSAGRPSCSDYESSDAGHFCPPNSPNSTKQL
ncbi:uncharacterized protein [Diadema antillarum]|uniref:uncharacterized protein n=1 Tax=Diadema antillarum TaxID=105358 RepID=UPI003A8A026B